MASGQGLERREIDGMAPLLEGSQALDLAGPTRARLPNHRRAAVGGAELQADGQVPRQQAKPDGHLVGMQAGTDQVIEIMPMNQLVNHLLDAPALPVQPDELAGAEALDTRHVDPRPAPIGGLPRGQSEQLQAGIPMAVA